MENIALYVIVNKDGEYFRVRHTLVGRAIWVPNITDAKIFTDISLARKVVDFFAKFQTSSLQLKIVKLTVTESDRIIVE
jgi:hypothetical protein